MSPTASTGLMTVPVSAYGVSTPTTGRSRIIPRCEQCGRRLAEYVSLPYSIKCHRCRHENRVD